MVCRLRGVPVFIAVLAALTVTGPEPVRAATGPALPESLAQPPDVVPPTTKIPVLPGLYKSLQGLDLAPQLLTQEFAEGGEILAINNTSTRGGPISRAFDTVVYWLDSVYTAITSGLTPPSPETFAKSVRSKDPYDFWKLVGDAGYKLKEISTDVGVVPDVGFKFKYVRELSDGDINWLERKLNRHAEKFGDPISLMQRTIIYTLLSINSSDVYYVDELRVKLMPLPKVQFSLMPWDNGLSEEHDTLLRAIQGKARVKRKPAEEDAHF
jgi:hypothetical protein